MFLRIEFYYYYVCIIDIGHSKLINHFPLILPFYKSCFILNKYLISLFSFQANSVLQPAPLLHMIQCSLNKSFCPFMEHVKASRSLFESIDTEGPLLPINLHPHKQPQRNNFHSSQFRAPSIHINPIWDTWISTFLIMLFERRRKAWWDFAWINQTKVTQNLGEMVFGEGY